MWLGRLKVFVLAVGVYFLLSFIYYLFVLFIYGTNGCFSYSPLSGIFGCSLSFAFDNVFAPYFVFTTDFSKAELAGGFIMLAFVVWIIRTLIYFLLFGLSYKLSVKVLPRLMKKFSKSKFQKLAPIRRS